MLRVNDEGISEEWFFNVLSNIDIWREIKKYMFLNKRSTNFYNYTDPFIAFRNKYFGLILECAPKLHITCSFLDFLAENGRLDLLRIHYSDTKRCTKIGIRNAAQNGHLDVVKFLYEDDFRNYTKELLYNAIFNKHYDIVRYLYDKSAVKREELQQLVTIINCNRPI